MPVGGRLRFSDLDPTIYTGPNSTDIPLSIEFGTSVHLIENAQGQTLVFTAEDEKEEEGEGTRFRNIATNPPI